MTDIEYRRNQSWSNTNVVLDTDWLYTRQIHSAVRFTVDVSTSCELDRLTVDFSYQGEVQDTFSTP
jgi:hypothetical protein